MQINPATSFARSYGGVPSLVAATSLLSLFPEGLYNLAQAVLVPFLVDKENIGAPGLAAVRSMMVMDPPPAAQVRVHALLRVAWGVPGMAAARSGLLMGPLLEAQVLRHICLPVLQIIHGIMRGHAWHGCHARGRSAETRRPQPRCGKALLAWQASLKTTQSQACCPSWGVHHVYGPCACAAEPTGLGFPGRRGAKAA